MCFFKLPELVVVGGEMPLAFERWVEKKKQQQLDYLVC
jgi:hypothetical protein